MQEKIADYSGRHISSSADGHYQVGIITGGFDCSGQFSGEPVGLIPAYELTGE
jgi:hypothetical protein